MLTKRNKQGYAVPASCHYAECDYRHCHDCAFVGRDGLLEIIENLQCKGEKPTPSGVGWIAHT